MCGGFDMTIEVLHYVKYVRLKSDLPTHRQTEAVRDHYPDAQNINYVEQDERGVVYRVESKLPERL